MRIENLIKRILEDYNIDLEREHEHYDPEQEVNYQEVDERVQELREKLDRFGPVLRRNVDIGQLRSQRRLGALDVG